MGVVALDGSKLAVNAALEAAQQRAEMDARAAWSVIFAMANTLAPFGSARV